MKVTKKRLTQLIEGTLFAEGKPMSAERLRQILPKEERPPLGEIREILQDLQKHYENRGVQLVEVASGYRFQVALCVSEHLIEQKDDKPMRFSKAFMETLALVAYRQPITRGEIEDIRGVVVSTQIIKTLLELEWIREVGFKDVPGKPALFATTKKFLDFFNLKSLEELPPIAELEELTETRLQEEMVRLDGIMPEASDEEQEETPEGTSDDISDETSEDTSDDTSDHTDDKIDLWVEEDIQTKIDAFSEVALIQKQPETLIQEDDELPKDAEM